MMVQREVLLFDTLVFALYSALRQATVDVAFGHHGAPFRSIDTVLVVDALLSWLLLVCHAQPRAVHLFEPSTDQHG